MEQHDMSVTTSKEAVRVRVSIFRDSSNQDFRGAHCGGVWFPASEITDALLENDPLPEHWVESQRKAQEKGDLGGGPVTDRQGKILPVYTLAQKLAHLYALEGRRRDEYGNWSDPGFEINDADNRTGNENRGQKPRAPILAKVIILDRRDEHGVWESEKKAQESASSTAAQKPPLSPQVRKP